MQTLGGADGGVAEVLTTEDFDAFPVIQVTRYNEDDRISLSWIRTTNGKVILGMLLAMVILVTILTVVIYDCKRRKGRR